METNEVQQIQPLAADPLRELTLAERKVLLAKIVQEAPTRPDGLTNWSLYFSTHPQESKLLGYDQGTDSVLWVRNNVLARDLVRNRLGRPKRSYKNRQRKTKDKVQKPKVERVKYVEPGSYDYSSFYKAIQEELDSLVERARKLKVIQEFLKGL